MNKLKIAALLLVLLTPFGFGFRASVVKVDITPEDSQWLVGFFARQSDGVHDPLFHRIVAMEDGDSLFILIASDLGGYSPSFYHSFRKQLEEVIEVERYQVWWTITHTHSGPELGPVTLAESFMPERFTHEFDVEYPRKITELLITGIQEAIAKLEPVRVGVGKGMALANINRRARTVDGKTVLGLNPYGPVDRQIGLIRMERPDGSPLALIANYAMHGTHLSGKNLKISGDAPGIVASYVEEKLRVPTLYINGAAGNISPIYNFHNNFRLITQFNVLLGDRILDANQSMRVGESLDTSLWLGQTVIETPKKEGLPWPDDLPDYLRVTAARDELIRVPVQFAKIGNDTVLYSAPLELFCELAIEIRNRSPFANTFFFGYSNGWLGYMPTKQAFGEGGYEMRVCPYTERVERDFVEGVVEFLQGIPR